MRIRSLAALAVAATALTPVGANADDYNCSIPLGSATNPQIQDAATDWYGIDRPLPGSVIPGYGDVHSDGTDLLDGWVSSSPGGPGGTTYRANMTIGKLDGTQANAIYTFQWTHDVGPVAQQLRYVSVVLNERSIPSYEWGYIDTSGEVNLTTSQGTTTGTLTQGTPGTLSVVIPFYNPALGKPSKLVAPFLETRILVGARGTGLLGLADDAKDVGPCFEITFI